MLRSYLNLQTVNFRLSLFLITEQYSTVQMYHIFFIHSSVEGNLGCFQFLATTNKVAMNIVEQVSLWYSWVSFGYTPRRGIGESQCRTFSNFLRNYQIYFQNGCTSLHSHQQWRSVPLAPHTCHHVLSLEFLILAILMGLRWNHIIM